MAKNLIIFFSRAGDNYVNGSIKNLPRGNTQVVAEFIQKAVDGDLFEVLTAAPYPTDYAKCTEVAKKELNFNSLPKLKNYLNSLDGYSNIFICGPCWWGSYPRAIFSLIERLDFTGKKVMAVVTHEGSGLGSCETELKQTCKGAVFGDGLAIRGSDAPSSESKVTLWAKNSLKI